LTSEDSVHSRYPFSLFLALIFAGLAGTYFRYPIFFNLDFLFGSIFALLVLQFFGPGRALLAALLISSYTFFLWHHPWGMVVMTAEMAVVGALVTRRKMGLLLADTLFWFLLGMPLVYLFYHVVMDFPNSATNITIVKQAVNGIANALIARLVFTGYTLYSRSLAISLRELLYNLLALFVLCPALVLLAAGSRADFAETDRSIRSSLLRDSAHVSGSLEHWLNARKAISVNLAGLAAVLPPAEMQQRLEQALGSDLYLLRIGLHDKEAVTVAHAPLTDGSGNSSLGKNFSDRPFIPTLKRTLKPMLSELVQGKIDAGTPRALMLAPVLAHGSYAGYIACVLNLDRVHAILQENADSEKMLYTLLDNNGKVILTNRAGQQEMTPLVRGQGELRHLDDGISQWLPALPLGTARGELWKQSLYIKKSAVGPFGEWDLVLEQPVEPFLRILYDRYAEKLALLLAVFLAALVAAEVLSRSIQASLLQLRALTCDLPARLAQGQQVSWPASPVLELRDLVDNFREMTLSHSARVAEIEQLNRTLELRVSSRTDELSSLNRDFVNFLENTSDFIYFKDQNSRFRFCSQTMASITGHASWRDMIGKHDSEVFPEDTARSYQEEELPIFRDGSTLLNKTNPYYDARGNKGWVSTNKWPVFDASHQVVGLFGISRDITETIRMQESLRLARLSLDQVPDAIIWVDSEGRIVDCNDGACQSLGYGQGELFGSAIFAVAPVATAESWPGIFEKIRGQKVKHFEATYQTKEGRGIPMDVQVAYIAFGEREFLCGIARDLSERTSMEEKLRRSEACLSRAQAIAKLGSWEWDPATDQVSCTDEIFNIFGIDREGFSGSFAALVQDIVHPEDRERVLEFGTRARQTGIGQTVEYRIVRPDGSIRWIRGIGEFVHDEDKQVKMVGANQDVTESKLLEEERLNLERQMLHLQKLESLGVLSGGIAHDFNNLLQVVLGNLDLTLMMLSEQSAVRKNLEQAVIAAVRASELSGMMLAYSGKGVLAIKELNLSGLMQENRAMLSAVIPKSLRFDSRLAGDLPPVQADATQLLQVVLNLVRNATESIGQGGGSITLATGAQEFDQPTLNRSRLEEKLATGRYVWVEVSDTGCGMDETAQYKVFDPFFTTKFTGRGLGMSAVLGIMRAHRGAIMLESNPGAGTRVRLLFPVAPNPRELRPALPAPSKSDAPAARQNTILVVDDEEMIRTLSSAMLEAFGFDTLVAADGQQALEIFRAEESRVTLVLLDQSMPIMDGLTVFNELRLIRGDIKVLLASGYSQQEVSARFKGLDLNGFIQKPYTVKALSEAVERVLKQS